VEITGAREIGTLVDDHYYIFQMPAGHHLMRPVVKLNDGRVERLEEHENRLFYAGQETGGFVIFRGAEPQLNVEQYAQSLLDMAEELDVPRIIVLGGVYGAVPHDRDRDISCVLHDPRAARGVGELCGALLRL
jgi:predicted ATP-grasp superfamily ATP-dependent carboligase